MNIYYITGSSKGLGKAIAEKLLEDSNNLVVGMSRSSSIDHPNYQHLRIDLTDFKAIQEFCFGDAPENIESITLINNAGVIGDIKPSGKLSSVTIAENYQVNLVAPSLLCNKFASSFQTINCEKLIINVSSGAGQSPIASWSSYCASKAGVDMLSLVFAEEQKSQEFSIKILSVAPGVVDTGMQQNIRNAEQKNFSRLADFVDMHKKGELASSATVAEKYISIIKNNKTFTETVISVKNL